MTNTLPNDALQVLVAYEDLAAGKRAMEMLERVSRQCGEPGRWVHSMWRFDVLADATYLTVAVSEALTADIIVIAAREGEPLPQRVRDWIAHWLLVKKDRPAALVATLDYPRPAQPCVLPYLEKSAHLGRLQFFANGQELKPAAFNP
jgi:hypothetical protein